MKCMKKEGFRTLTREETLDLGRKSCGLKVLREKRVFGRWKDRKQSREIEKKLWKIMQTLYIEIFVARWIKRFWALKTRVLSVEELSRICREVSTAKRISMDRGSCQGAIKHLESFSMDQSSYREVSKGIENAIKSSWRISIDSLAVERCPVDVEIA